jgi:hypothetical protein
MDGESFDRLSVVVHRLRDTATRRGALRLLLGGSAATALLVLEGETEARRRRRRRGRCKGFGGRCGSSRDCCDGRCRNGFCFPGGGGGGNNCNGQRCPDGWGCCRVSGVDVCVPRNHPACFNNGICPNTWRTCGFNGPVRRCCQPNERCCNNGQFDNFCLNDFFNCDDFFPDSLRAEGAPEVSEPIPVTEIDPEEFD